MEGRLSPRARRCSKADEDEIWTFILLRRMTLFAWMGSHRRNRPRQARKGRLLRPAPARLAETYLSRYAVRILVGAPDGRQVKQSPAKQEFIAKSMHFWNPGKTQFWQDADVDLVIDRREGYLL